MTNIYNNYNSSNYQLFNSNSASSAELAAKTTPSLANILGADSDAASNAAYDLNLSDSALAFLSGTSTTSTDSSAKTDQFVLSADQQKRLKEILTKYKDAPFTQETFDKIQSELSVNGLSPDQVAGVDGLRKFSPTSILLKALGGDFSDSNTSDSAAELTAKKDNYLKSVQEAWKEISTTVKSTTEA